MLAVVPRIAGVPVRRRVGGTYDESLANVTHFDDERRR
jgi:hypothetical protein